MNGNIVIHISHLPYECKCMTSGKYMNENTRLPYSHSSASNLKRMNDNLALYKIHDIYSKPPCMEELARFCSMSENRSNFNNSRQNQIFGWNKISINHEIIWKHYTPSCSETISNSQNTWSFFSGGLHNINAIFECFSFGMMWVSACRCLRKQKAEPKHLLISVHG